MKTSLASCALAFTFASLATADEITHRAAAEKVVDCTDLSKGIQGMLPMMIGQLTQRMQAQSIPAPLIEEAKTVVNGWFATEVKWGEVKPQVVEIFTKEFTEEELAGLLKFYQSPLGQRFLEKMPQAFQQTMQVSQTYLQKKQPSLTPLLNPIIEKAKKAQTP